MVEAFYFLNLLFVESFLKPSEHAVICHFCGVGYEGEDSMVYIAFHCVENGLHEQLAEFFPFLIDVAV